MRALAPTLAALFARGVDESLADEEFNALALEIFAYQYSRCEPYRAICDLRGATPEVVRFYQDIPAVHTDLFKPRRGVVFSSCAPEERAVVYRTTGTTRGPALRGEVHLPDTKLYDASLLPNFEGRLLPDGARLPMLIVGPTAELFPHSSLGHMFSAVRDQFGSAGSGAYWSANGVEGEKFASALRRAEGEGRPVCILGTTGAMALFLDRCEGTGERFELPAGSRLMDTGGSKGLPRPIPRPELLERYEGCLGLPRSHIVNEYGMTEMASQFYDSSLRDHHQGVRRPPRMMPPPWVRTLVVHPETLGVQPEGEPGLLRHYDLANLHTVMAVQTDDLGVGDGDGLRVIGRVPGAESRGCSLAVEDLVRAA